MVAQISKRNTARLQYLAHLVSESLVSIAEHMQGIWEDVSPALKTKLDEFEVYVFLSCHVMKFMESYRILKDVLKTVKRHTSSSSMIAFFNAGDRDFDITMLEKRLSDARSSILVSGYVLYYKLIPHSIISAFVRRRCIGNGRSI